jgi:hypothetical protein
MPSRRREDDIRRDVPPPTEGDPIEEQLDDPRVEPGSQPWHQQPEGKPDPTLSEVSDRDVADRAPPVR